MLGSAALGVPAVTAVGSAVEAAGRICVGRGGKIIAATFSCAGGPAGAIAAMAARVGVDAATGGSLGTVLSVSSTAFRGCPGETCISTSPLVEVDAETVFTV